MYPDQSLNMQCDEMRVRRLRREKMVVKLSPKLTSKLSILQEKAIKYHLNLQRSQVLFDQIVQTN